jgi:cysteine desulfurase
MNTHYFDYAAASPMSPAVMAAMQPYFSDKFYNPSALYLAAQEVKQAIHDSRALVARHLGAKPSEVIFTAGGTEANNLAINGVLSQFPGKSVLTSSIEHDSVLVTAALYNHTVAPVNSEGLIDTQELERLINDDTVLISVMYVNNEIGTIQPLARIAKIVSLVRIDRTKRGIDTPLYLHTDACQAPNYLQVLVHTLGVDMMTLNGGKIYGPKQSGVLYLKTGVQLRPEITGGGQERNMRSGTENVPAIVGFATALDETQMSREAETKRLRKLQQQLFIGLAEKLPTAQINGNKKYRVPNNIHLTIPGSDNERLMMALDEKGLMVATGSACSASSDEPSHVLQAIGLSDEQARSSLRMTLGRQSDPVAIAALLDGLTSIL